jgi:hypothetical protein
MVQDADSSAHRVTCSAAATPIPWHIGVAMQTEAALLRAQYLDQTRENVDLTN